MTTNSDNQHTEREQTKLKKQHQESTCQNVRKQQYTTHKEWNTAAIAQKERGWRRGPTKPRENIKRTGAEQNDDIHKRQQKAKWTRNNEMAKRWTNRNVQDTAFNQCENQKLKLLKNQKNGSTHRRRITPKKMHETNTMPTQPMKKSKKRLVTWKTRIPGEGDWGQ